MESQGGWSITRGRTRTFPLLPSRSSASSSSPFLRLLLLLFCSLLNALLASRATSEASLESGGNKEEELESPSRGKPGASFLFFSAAAAAVTAARTAASSPNLSAAAFLLWSDTVNPYISSTQPQAFFVSASRNIRWLVSSQSGARSARSRARIQVGELPTGAISSASSLVIRPVFFPRALATRGRYSSLEGSM